MKIIITESKLNNTIMYYLDKNYIPDYGWSDNEDYANEISEYDKYDFYVDDEIFYTYSKWGDGLDELYLRDNVINSLTDLFGNHWAPVFKEWFESNTGLKVDSMVDGYFNTLI